MTTGPSRRDLWDERHAARDPIESHAPDPALVELVAGLAPGRALDLATGDGRNAIRLAGDGWAVTAVDFSTVALERAGRSAAAAGVEVAWVAADLLAWRPPPRSFDLVVIVYLHLPGDERRGVYAAAAEAVARAGGCWSWATTGPTCSRGAAGRRTPTCCSPPTRWPLISRASRWSGQSA